VLLLLFAYGELEALSQWVTGDESEIVEDAREIVELERALLSKETSISSLFVLLECQTTYCWNGEAFEFNNGLG